MLADLGPARARQAFWVLALVAVATLMWLGRGLTFFSDEWAFITGRSLGDPGTWWAPHNGHWSTVAVIAYRGLVEIVGLRSYVPYLLVVAVLHVLVAWLVYRAVERHAGPGLALCAGGLVLFFGAGFENLYWAFQIGFVSALLGGLIALEALDGPPSRGRAAVLAVALLVAEMTAGIGVIFIGATGLMILMTPEWRTRLGLLVVPLGAYLAWLLLVGWSGVGVFRDPLAPSSLLAIPGYVLNGFESAVGAATGLAALGPLLVIATVLAASLALAGGARPPPRILALLLAIAAEYALIAATRAGVTADQVLYPRYTYVAGILMVEVLALAAGPALSWLRGRAAVSGQRWPSLVGLAMVPVVLTFALIWNLGLLVSGRTVFLDRAAITRALIAESVRPDPVPGSDLTRDLIVVPAPVVLRELVAEHGSPLGDVILPWAVEPIPQSLLVEARRRLVEGPPLNLPENAP